MPAPLRSFDATRRGWNSHDTLGLDCDAEWVKTPRRVRAFPFKPLPGRGGDGGETRDENNGSITHAAEGGIRQGALGGWHALAVDHEGQTFAWGGNEYGQAGVDCGTAGNGGAAQVDP